MKKIVLFGDSIRKGYDKYTRMAFKGIAEVYYHEQNGEFAAYTLRHIPEWKEEMKCGDDVDCVHWNAGLWDTLILPDGEHLVPVEIYKYYMERVCKEIKRLFPKAKVIFATSTPVLEELFVTYKRYNRDIELYNAAAVAIAKENGFYINDLYDIAKNAPTGYHSDLTHYYTKDGTRLITSKVIKCIERCIGIRANEPDYDAIFAAAEDIKGI